MMKWNRIQVLSALLIAGLFCVIAQAADISRSDIPSGSNWYVHINLDLIQNSEVGRRLMAETIDEALDEIQGELDIDLRSEVEGITVFGGKLPERGNVAKEGAVIFHGALSQHTQEELLAALGRKGADVTALDSAGLTYYKLVNDGGSMTYTDKDGHEEDVDFGHRQDVYFSFGLSQALVTQNLDLMQAFLDAGGYLGGFETVDSQALLVLQADRALMQGGANTSTQTGGEWDSSILKNVDAVALVIAEQNSGLQVSAQLTATSPDMAMAVRNIVEGVVALKALDESDGELGEILRQIRFENDGPDLHINVPVTSAQIEALRDL